MGLRTRLILQGAVVPTILLALALALAGLMFDRNLHLSIDRALMAQAGVEAVSLFDRAGAPHLHLVSSPMDNEVRELAPVAALYDPQGELVTVYPEGARVPERLEPGGLSTTSRLSTEPAIGWDGAKDRSAGPGRRVLEVRVDSPEGEPYALWLAASLERHDAAVAAFWRVSGASVFVGLLMLLGIQARNASMLHLRIEALAAHMARLREGELTARPPEDEGDDVISELRDAIADATERLELASEAQDRLVANAAHELRTPLTAMRIRIDVVRRRSRPSGEYEVALDALRDEVDRLAGLASQLLDLAELRAGTTADRRRSIDVELLVGEAVEPLRMVAEARGISVVWRERDAGVEDLARWSVEGHPHRLRQAVDNLLENAVKFSPEGGVVTVGIERDGGLLRVSVVDEGPGVRPEQREAIFEPFARIERSVDGTGLGLAIVRDVAAAHGGQVFVADAELGHAGGARFVLELPAQKKPRECLPG